MSYRFNVITGKLDYYNGSKKNIKEKTADYTLTSTDDVIVCNSTTTFTLTLPTATGTGKTFYIKNINTADITTDANSSETIDDELTQTVSQYDCMKILDYASGKWIII